MQATALNKKEDRVLQKTFGTLNLEMSFTYNVLSLRVRTVKANFKRLRDRVDKLKSNLTPEEIKALRQMEEEGKLKTTSTFNVNAAMKIAAAARRLNLYPEGIKRSRTSLSPKRVRTSDKLLPSRSKTDTNLLRTRSNSVTGVFIDAPSDTSTVRRNSIESANPACALQKLVRPVSAAQPSVTQQDNGLKVTQSVSDMRPATSLATDRDKQTVQKACKTTTHPAKSPVRAQTPEVSMSDIFHRGEYVPEKGKAKSPRDKMSLMNVTDETLDTGRTKLFEDRRQELIQDEQIFLKGLEKRKKEFITDVDMYLQLNPPARFDTPLVAADLPGFESNATGDPGDEDDDVMKYTRRRRQIRRYDSARTFTSEAEYKQREDGLWKDMNKTRYLRISEENMDLSGVVTLAKDQMKLFKMLQMQEPSHIVIH